MKVDIDEIEIKEEVEKTKNKKTVSSTTETKNKDIKKKNTPKENKKETELEKIINDLKSKYSILYRNIIDNEVYIWRPLKRAEYREINKIIEREKDENLTDLDILFIRQEEIVKNAVVYPENIEKRIEEKGGLATVLSDEIMEMSGFNISYTEKL